MSQVQALTELPTPISPLRGAYYLIGNVSKMNLKVNKSCTPKEKEKTPFFVPKTVDMLVQHPQDQAINLFSLINKSKREVVGLQGGLGPEIMKDSF